MRDQYSKLTILKKAVSLSSVNLLVLTMYFKERFTTQVICHVATLEHSGIRVLSQKLHTQGRIPTYVLFIRYGNGGTYYSDAGWSFTQYISTVANWSMDDSSLGSAKTFHISIKSVPAVCH